MTNIDITRRALLGGLASAGAVSAPAVVSAAVAECPYEKVHRLTAELSEALRYYRDGRWMAQVLPAEMSGAAVMLQPIQWMYDPAFRLSTATAEAKQAMFMLTGQRPYDATVIDGRRHVVAFGVLPEFKTKLRWFFDDDQPLFGSDRKVQA
jgi:hypothetical protein